MHPSSNIVPFHVKIKYITMSILLLFLACTFELLSCENFLVNGFYMKQRLDKYGSISILQTRQSQDGYDCENEAISKWLPAFFLKQKEVKAGLLPLQSQTLPKQEDG